MPPHPECARERGYTAVQPTVIRPMDAVLRGEDWAWRMAPQQRHPMTADGPAGRRATFRSLWFKRYPAAQTFVAFLVAMLATAALSVDPTAASHHAIMKIDPTATGALYICYEVLLSFAGHTDAMLYLALACLLTFPVRYVLFSRRERPRPSVAILALAYAACMVFGRSYDLMDGAGLVFGGISRCIMSLISGAGWTVLAYIAISLLFECLDWFGAHRLRFTEAHFGRLWRAADLILNRHPFAIPAALIALAWLPTFIACMPGLFMGDTGAQIRQWFNLPNGTSEYLDLINPDVLLNGHHPVVHTALLGGCVQLGMDLLGSENAGLLIYTTLQFTATVLTVGYLVSSLKRFGAGLIPRAVVLAFFAFMPMFPNYAVLATKDVLFGDAFALLVVQTAKLLVPVSVPAPSPVSGVHAREDEGEGPVRCESAPRPGAPSKAASAASSSRDASPTPGHRRMVDIEFSLATGMRIAGLPVSIPFAAHDWALLVLAALGCAFLRNGGVVFPIVVGMPVAAFRLAAIVRARRTCGARASRGVLAGVLAVMVVTVALYGGFTRILMPALDITPGSRREALSIPFQQTARFVSKHDSANAGIEDGAGTADGLITAEQRAVIDAVLDYGTLASRYDPDKSDAVKNGFNEDATPEQLGAYFKVWAQMFAKDPESYISAVANNYYGYFYPSRKDAFTYSTALSADIMARKGNRAYFDFHPAGGPIVVACDHLVTLYRVSVQRIPLLSLALSSSTYVWLMLLACVYLLRGRQWRGLALFLPLLGVLAVCLIGPCNGATYMRYLYPMIVALPFVAPVALVWPRRLWRSR